MTISSAPDLLAIALGRPRGGSGRCCYCGASASDPHILPESFTALDTLAVPGSGFRCAGCAAAMTATRGQSPDGKSWMWSWVITRAGAERHALCTMLGGARIRAGRAALRAACLAPPGPPYVIALNEAGRTHTLYRSAVHRGGAGASLAHDGRVLRYEPADLRARIALCERIAAALGSKVARDRLAVSSARWAVELIDDLEIWHAVLQEPLTAAAACLFDSPEVTDE